MPCHWGPSKLPQLGWWMNQPLRPQPLLSLQKACQQDWGDPWNIPSNVFLHCKLRWQSTVSTFWSAKWLQEFLWGWPIVLLHGLPKLTYKIWKCCKSSPDLQSLSDEYQHVCTHYAQRRTELLIRKLLHLHKNNKHGKNIQWFFKI